MKYYKQIKNTQGMKKFLRNGQCALLLCGLALGNLSCGGSSSSAPADATTTTTTTTDADGDVQSASTTGIAVPKKLNPVPAASDSGAGASSLRGISSLKSMFTKSGSVSVKSTTDYDNDTLELKVSERALDQFTIIETVLGALQQTGYDDSRVINKEPYGALIAWKEEDGTRLERWIIKSKMIVEEGRDVNKVQAWIVEDTSLVKAQFKIYEAPSALNKYGVWRIDVAFLNAAGTQYGSFVASSEVDANGNAVVKINNPEERDGVETVTQGLLVLNNTTGSGIVNYPSYSHGGGGSPTVTQKTVRYGYNTNHLILENDGTQSCKNRTEYTDIYLDYNLYTSAGANIRKSKNFGLPVTYTDGSGSTKYLYYGGWKGRHFIWGGGDNLTLAIGDTLTGADKDAASYTLGARYNGYLVEKALITASMADIVDEKLGAFVFLGFNLKYDAANTRWELCNGSNGPWDCSSTVDSAYTLAGLQSNEQNRKFVNIFNNNGQQLTLNNAGTGFNSYTPSDGDSININMSEEIYISWNGTGWSKYSATFTAGEYRPELSNPQSYSFAIDGKYYLNSDGLNYILTVANAQTTPTFSLEKEIEDVIQPGEEAEALSAVTFTANGSNYTWDATNLLLKDSNNETQAQSVWQLEGNNGKKYTWEYAAQGETWRILSYLKDSNNQFVFLDDPIRFAQFTVDGKSISSLAFDGHLFGIPNVWEMLERNDWTLTQAMKDKVINLDAMTLTDKDNSSVTYKIKPVFGMRVLEDVVLASCEVSIDNSLSLTNLPAFEDHGMGALPAVDTITVAEGKFLEE